VGAKKERIEAGILSRRGKKTNSNVGGPRWREQSGYDWDKPGVHWDRVKHIISAGERKIYDLTIAKTHCFIANDIIVHNTWMEMVCAGHNWGNGYVPLVFSREMAVWQISRRLDAIIAQLPYRRFKAGELTSVEKALWLQALEDMKSEKPFWITGDDGDGHEDVEDVRGLIQKKDIEQVGGTNE